MQEDVRCGRCGSTPKVTQDGKMWRFECGKCGLDGTIFVTGGVSREKAFEEYVAFWQRTVGSTAMADNRTT